MEDEVTDAPSLIDDEDDDEGVLDRARDMPVGTRDPNIIGDAGPTDVPPGADPTEANTDDDPGGPSGGSASGHAS